MGWKSQAVIAQQVIIEGTGDGLFVYSGTPGLGNLIASIASAGGTDSFTNPDVAGIATYSTINQVVIRMAGGGISFQSQNAASRIVTAGTILLTDPVADNQAPQITVTTPKTAAASAAVLILTGESKDASTPSQWTLSPGGTIFGSVTVNGGPAILVGQAAPAAIAGDSVIYADANGVLRVIDGLDGLTYGCERLTLDHATGTQLINSTAFATITGLTAALAAGKYRVSGVVLYTGGQAAGTPLFQFAFTGITASVQIAVRYQDMQGTSLVSGDHLTALNASTAGPTLLNGGLQGAFFDGIMSLSTSGTLSLQAAEGTNLDVFTVQNRAYLDLMPV